MSLSHRPLSVDLDLDPISFAGGEYRAFPEFIAAIHCIVQDQLPILTRSRTEYCGMGVIGWNLAPENQSPEFFAVVVLC
jgi:hypothetical protein